MSVNTASTQTLPDNTGSNQKRAQKLDVAAMPLIGRHLIEASAGTGKTFNITRLYLRLLLEKKLTVKEILVMTFTKAATEEIKGRVAKTLREATQIWQQAKDNNDQIATDCDPVFQTLFNNNDVDESVALLKAAQLELDEASVFTIHGFCQHVITQLAFNSGFSMSLNLGNDTSDLYLQAAEDYIRKVSQRESDFLLLAQSGWHVPDRLLYEFNRSIRSSLMPIILDEKTIEAAFVDALNNNQETALSQFKTLLERVKDNESLLIEQLIKTPAHKKDRPQELEALKSWLSDCSQRCTYELAPPLALAFLDGRRYARNQSGVKEILSPIKDFAKSIETAVTDKENALAQLPVFRLVYEAIDFIKTRVEKEKKQRGVIDFDDLIQMLANEVTKPNNTLVTELRKKFPVALIDEFQDTDAKQYAILDAVYPNALSVNNNESSRLLKAEEDVNVTAKDSALLMIGDPKQAIYRFRGGDIFTYLKAGKQADYRWVMNTNWRSVEGMVNAYNRLFYGAPVASDASSTPTDVFGFDIRYEPVAFTPKAEAAKTPLIDPNERRSALNYVSLHLDNKQDATTMRRGMAQWIAQEIYRLLNEARFLDGERRLDVKPKDIAILVKDRTEANVIKYVLQHKGIACVYLSDRSNLFTSLEAKDVLRLLNGIWHASDSSKVASSLASPLWGYSPATLIELLYHESDALWDSAFDKVLTLKDMWLQKGCMSVLLHLMQSSYQPFGNEVERALTNYQHLAEVLEKASTTHQRPEQLLDWLSKQINQPDSDEELTLRLESDSQLIRIVTQHGSKGLEYPIVFVPFATGYKDAARNGKSMSQIFTYYDDAKEDLQLQLGQTRQAIARVREEGEAEDMRLAYVAVTRAAHRCYMGIIPLEGNEKSALARAMGMRGAEQSTWSEVLASISQEDGANTRHIAADEFEEIYTGLSQEETLPPLHTLQFSGTSSEDWRLYSFSAISRLTTVVNANNVTSSGIRGVPLHSVPVLQTSRDDEVHETSALLYADGKALVDISASAVQQSPLSTLSKSLLRFTLEKGASAGNLLHDLLEHNDFSAPEWEETGKELVLRFGLEESRVDALYNWLDEVLHTPLNPLNQCSLSDLPQQKTLREAEFYFPLKDSQWSQLRQVLSAHRQQLAKALNTVAEEVPHLMAAQLAGMMHGFIDLIFEYDGKFYVADYKSTWLGDTIESYLPMALFQNNQHHLYDLQYLIYCLALHRYLKNTLADYNPCLHFGGVYYLYLRGMHPDNQRGEGVFYTAITQDVLKQLDTIFDGKLSASHNGVVANNGVITQKENATRTGKSANMGQQQFSFDDEDSENGE